MKIQNTSGQSFVFSEIKRKVTPEPRKVHLFSEEEIEKDGFLRNLIKKGIFVEVDYEDVPEEKIKEKEFEKVKNLFDDNQIAVEVGGRKEDDIERFGRDPNKTVCVEPNKLLSRGNSQIIEERIAKKEFIEPIMNYGEKSVFEFGNTNEDFFIDSEPVRNLSKESKIVKKKQTELWFNSPANDSSGYGKFGRECVKGLHRRGVNVHLDLFKIPDFRSSVPLTPEIEEMMENEVSLQAPSVWAIMPPKYLHRVGRKVLYTMMETNAVPPRFAEKCNLADELWLPSLHNMQIFEEAKVKPELFHMPLGVNTDLYKPMVITEGQKSLFDIKTKGFVFMSLFGWSLRKGTDAMLKAYLQTFTKEDDVTLLIVSRKDGMTAKNKNDEIRKEITKYIKRWSPEKHPHIVHIGDNIAEEKLPILYNMSDCFLTLSRGEGFCGLYDAKIKTPKGIKNLGEMKEGDKVFTHKGTESKVVKTFKREYDGEMIKVKCVGRNNQYLTLTPNHMVRAIRTSELCSLTVTKLLRNCNYNFEKDTLNHCHKNINHPHDKHSKYNLEWIRIDELKKGDMIFYPKIKYENNLKEIDLSKIPNINKRNIIKNGKIYKCNTKDFEINQKSKYCLLGKDKIRINKDFMKLCGYYVAEGNSSFEKSTINFSFHEEEKKYINEVNELMFNVFGLEKKKPNNPEDKKSYTLNFYSSVVSDLFLYLFKHKARNKKIPNWFFNLEEDLIIEFLIGLFRGDGSFGKQRSKGGISCDKVSFSTASIDLANNVFDLLQQRNIPSTIKKRIINNEKTQGFEKEYYSVNITNIKHHNILMEKFGEKDKKLNSNRHYECFKTDKDFQLLKIREIKKINYKGKVYNIGVEGDNSYICDNYAVHNCMPMMEAGSCEKPVIATRCSGQLDFLTDKNSYLVDIEGYDIANQEMQQNSSYYENQPFAVLGDTTVNQTKEIMYSIYKDKKEAQEKGKTLRRDLVNAFTWDHFSDRIYERVLKIQG